MRRRAAWKYPYAAVYSPPMPRRAVSAQELEYYRAHFREALREDGVVCLECGGLYRALGCHVRAHDLTIVEYRERWGYNRQQTFLARATREALRAVTLARNLGAHGSSDTIRRAQEAKRRLGPQRCRLQARLGLQDRGLAQVAAGRGPLIQKATPETLRALARAGFTSREIADRTGLTRDHVRERLRALGLVPRFQPRVSDGAILALARPASGPARSPPAPG